MDFFVTFIVFPATVAAFLWPLVISIISSEDPPPSSGRGTGGSRFAARVYRRGPGLGLSSRIVKKIETDFDFTE